MSRWIVGAALVANLAFSILVLRQQREDHRRVACKIQFLAIQVAGLADRPVAPTGPEFIKELRSGFPTLCP